MNNHNYGESSKYSKLQTKKYALIKNKTSKSIKIIDYHDTIDVHDDFTANYPGIIIDIDMKSICQQQLKLEEPAAVLRFHLRQVANQSISCFFSQHLNESQKLEAAKVTEKNSKQLHGTVVVVYNDYIELM